MGERIVAPRFAPTASSPAGGKGLGTMTKNPKSSRNNETKNNSDDGGRKRVASVFGNSLGLFDDAEKNS